MEGMELMVKKMLNTEQTMSNTTLTQLQEGLTTAYIDGTAAANLAYKPAFVSNNPDEGKKVISVIEDELMKCDQFQISVAFITMGGITPLLQTLKELEKRQIPGQILTTNYLNFSEPRALKKLQELSNVTLKMYDVDRADQGFHTKGYIFKKEEIYRIIIGSSNITSAALTKNKEWNTKIVSTEQGEIAMEIVKEFHQLWDSKYALFYDDFYENYKQKYEIIKKQREIAKRDEIASTEKYKLEPNSMQVGFITNLRRIVDAGENRALLISATGTGKTYASAFAMRELGFKRVLFLVHRSTLAKQALTSFRKVFEDKKSMGIVGAGYSDYDADYIFAMVETLHKEDNLRKFAPEEFDCIVLDEAHHSPANTYQKVMEYFKPKLFLGMTATPDKRDDGDASKNVYELFHYQIAYEIRLQQAMEEDLLCPFHYFGISDISVVTDEQMKARNISEEDFGKLTSDERVRHVIEQAKYYGYSGDRVKGLVFCSRNRECEELSAKFNALGYRTIALSGDNKDKEREKAFERLAMNEEDATDEMQPLDYIFSVDILNEGVDIVEVNQVIMLRPTQSPIVFIQQLGRGLRKAENKEYVVILDFIGNYNNNFMIPVALSGDRTYNADTIRKYVISGNNTIPGASTVHFDEIAKEKIFNSIDKIKGMRSIIKESYISLKNRIGRTPLLFDFYEQGEIDPLVIIREYKTYWQFLEAVEKGKYFSKLTDHEKLILDYLSKTILSGVRPSELFLLQKLLTKKTFSVNEVQKELKRLLDYNITDLEMRESVKILQGCFTSKDEEYQKYKTIEIMDYDEKQGVRCFASYANCLLDNEFNTQVKDIINVGLARYRDKYAHGKVEQTPFVLYEKYSRRDVSLLMNCGKDMSSTMYGMSRIGDVYSFLLHIIRKRPKRARTTRMENLIMRMLSRII
jgi:superfamily II DNA or RNA helicase